MIAVKFDYKNEFPPTRSVIYIHTVAYKLYNGKVEFQMHASYYKFYAKVLSYHVSQGSRLYAEMSYINFPCVHLCRTAGGTC